MNRLLVTSLVFVCSYSLAHEPYVAPLAYKTEQTQVPVIAGYAEEALNSEYALKDAKLTVITPKQDPKVINAEALHKSVTVFVMRDEINSAFFEIIAFPSRCTLCKIISNIKH